MLPKNDDFCVEQFVKRNAPCAFRAPKRCAEANQPRSVAGSARSASLHLLACIVLQAVASIRYDQRVFEIAEQGSACVPLAIQEQRKPEARATSKKY
jgi:hypothetical protein